MLTLSSLLVLLFGVSSNAFTVVNPPNSRTTSTSALEMGLFDGVKDAFGAPALERSTLDAERETPIDRWMGWSVVSDKENQQVGTSRVKLYIL